MTQHFNSGHHYLESCRTTMCVPSEIHRYVFCTKLSPCWCRWQKHPDVLWMNIGAAVGRFLKKNGRRIGRAQNGQRPLQETRKQRLYNIANFYFNAHRSESESELATWPAFSGKRCYIWTFLRKFNMEKFVCIPNINWLSFQLWLVQQRESMQNFPP